MARFRKSSYLPDRFDEVDPDITYVGMYRQKRVVWFMFLPIVASVALTALLVTAGALFIGHSGENLSIEQNNVSQISGDVSGNELTEDAAPTEPVPPPEVVPITEPTPADVENLTIVVLNGTEVQGMAARAVSRLVIRGWPEASATNADSSDVSLSVVAYSEEADRGIALGIALELDLDADAVVETSAYVDARITVVLGADYVDTEAT